MPPHTIKIKEEKYDERDEIIARLKREKAELIAEHAKTLDLMSKQIEEVHRKVNKLYNLVICKVENFETQ